MWTCPTCGRVFRRRDQNHSCTLITKENIFDRRSPSLKLIYGKLVKVIKRFGEYRQEALKPDVIFFKTKSTFLALKVKKDRLVVEFFLDKLEDMPPVYKHLQTSKHRFVHLVAVDDKRDITPQLIKWMRRSYELVAN